MADDLVKWLRHHDLNATCWVWEADDIRKILEAADTIEQQQASIDKYRKALIDIRDHMMIIAPTTGQMSTIWVIANKALGDE